MGDLHNITVDFCLETDDVCQVAVWQDDIRLATVLQLILKWLRARDLCFAARVCGSWHEASQASAVWRAALLNELQLRAVNNISARLQNMPIYTDVTWHQECKAILSEWQCVNTKTLLEEVECISCYGHQVAILICGDACAKLLLCDDNGQELLCLDIDGGNGGGGAIRWSPDGYHLMVTRPVPFSYKWEAKIYRIRYDLSREGGWQVDMSLRCRVRHGCGAGGCAWASCDIVIGAEPALLSPPPARLAATAIWAYTLDQCASSEHECVAAPLFRIFNEGHANLIDIVAAEMCDDCLDFSSDAAPDNADEDLMLQDKEERYYNSMFSDYSCTHEECRVPVLVFALGAGLRAVRVRSPRPRAAPPAPGALRERSRRRRARAAAGAPDHDPPPPTEQQVRALCIREDASVSLRGRIHGLTLRQNTPSNASVVWAGVTSGSQCSCVCVCVRTMCVLRTVSARVCVPPPHIFSPPTVTDRCIAFVFGTQAALWSSVSGAPLLAPRAYTRALAFTSDRHIISAAGNLLKVWRTIADMCDNVTDDVSEEDSCHTDNYTDPY